MTIPSWLVWLVGALALAYILAPDSQYGAGVETMGRDAHNAVCE